MIKVYPISYSVNNFNMTFSCTFASKKSVCFFSELHKQHRDKLEEITHRFENIKMGLSVSVDQWWILTKRKLLLQFLIFKLHLIHGRKCFFPFNHWNYNHLTVFVIYVNSFYNVCMCTTCTYCDIQDKVETLRSECDDLRTRARSSEEALLRDSDVKVQVPLWYQ